MKAPSNSPDQGISIEAVERKPETSHEMWARIFSLLIDARLKVFQRNLIVNSFQTNWYEPAPLFLPKGMILCPIEPFIINAV